MTLTSLKRSLQALALLMTVLLAPLARATALPLPDEPLFTSYSASPIVMLDISRDHQLFYKAYNDYTDLNGNGTLDETETTFNNSFLYYGYFDPTKCYSYASESSKFSPTTTGGGTTAPADCSGNWSGNFLNWVSMSRLDIMRKVLFGGLRSSETGSSTVLERATIPTDAHSWVKYYSDSKLGNFTPFTSANNPSGVSFCNTSYATTGKSHSTTAAPVFRRASGDYRNWTSNELKQCYWKGDYSTTFNPSKPSSDDEFIVRVDACVSGKIGTENCKSYDGTNYKPIGLLQKYGERSGTTSDYRPRIYFGLMTGSYIKNISGGVLRKAATLPLSNTGDTTKDEIKASDGTFTGNDGIIKTISELRIYGYNYDSGLYFGGSGESDSCNYQQTGIVSDGSGKNEQGKPANEGNCASWGNPMSEVYIESLRYLAGKSPTSAFLYSGTSNADGRVGLSEPAAWGSGPLTKDNYCSPLNVLMFNASVSSFDSDQASSPFASLKGSPNLSKWTDSVGSGEGISGISAFVGRIGGSASDEGICTAKTVSSLSSFSGICPEAPSLYGSYFMAGAAYFAHTNAIRDRISGANDSSTPYTVKSYAVQMATNVPRIKIPNTNVVIQPAYFLQYGNKGTGTIVDFRIKTLPTATGGKFEILWEDSNQGGDYDQDVRGTIEYSVTGSTLTITTQVTSASTAHAQGFGYTISGTDKDGAHFHSGIYGFKYSDSASSACASECNDSTSSNSAGPVTTATYTISNGSGAKALEDPMFYAAKWGGFDATDSVTTPSSTTSWDKLNNSTGAAGADGLPDNYFYVTNPGILEASLDRALSGISDTTAGSAASASTGTLQTGTSIYQGLFTPKSWTGDLLAYSLDPSSLALTQSWSAAAQLGSKAATDRVIVTTSTTTTTDAGGNTSTTRSGSPFRWTNIGAAQKTALGYDSAVADSETTAQNRLNYLRGDATNEGADSGKFRVRSVKLGDIVDSTPVYVGKPAGQYTSANRFLNAYINDTGYTTFRSGKLNRNPVVYVGANDGMMHGFNATSGAEVLAYVPSQVYGTIASLSNQDYNSKHKFSVDGTPEVADAKVETAWKTVLVSGLRKGGKGIFALDVSDPSRFTEANASSIALFEFLDSDDPGNDMGYVYGSPVIAKMANGSWAAIFGNGYNSGNERPVVYIVYLKSGTNGWAATDFVKLTVPDTATGSNGMGPVSVFDKDLDGVADTIYAGDLKGNLWKFDVSSTSSSSWALASNGSPLAKATDSGGNARPITNAPAVTWHPNDLSTTLVYFGSGRYLTSGDVISTETDTMYGVWDDNSTSAITRAKLQSQSIGTDSPRAISSTATVDWGSGSGKEMGWYEDLPGSGERVTGTPTVLGGTVFYNTFMPNTNICDCGGTGYLMAVSYLSGGATSGIFTGLNTNTIGIQIGGVLGGSTILPPGSSDTGVAVSNTTKPSDPSQPKPVTTELSGTAFNGTRLSWRELIRK